MICFLSSFVFPMSVVYDYWSVFMCCMCSYPVCVMPVHVPWLCLSVTKSFAVSLLKGNKNMIKELCVFITYIFDRISQRKKSLIYLGWPKITLKTSNICYQPKPTFCFKLFMEYLLCLCLLSTWLPLSANDYPKHKNTYALF